MTTRKWGSEHLVNTTTAGAQLYSEVAALRSGGFIVVWEDDGPADSAIRGQRYDAAGNPVGGEIAIATAAGNDRVLPSVAGLADGGFYVTYTQLTGADNYILGKVYDANGTFVRDQTVTFAVGLDNSSDVAALGSGSVVTWYDPDTTNGEIDFRIFDAAGNGTGVLVADSDTSHSQQEPVVAVSPDGSYVAVMWRDVALLSIRGRIFDDTGSPYQGQSEFGGLNGTIANGPPAVTWLNNGTFAVAWTQDDPDPGGGPGGWDIHVKLFFTAGRSTPLALTDAIRVNANLLNDQVNPAITGLPDGSFVVSWTDSSQTGPDGSGSAIRLQAFDGGGNRSGSEVVINTTTSLDQLDSSVAALSDGRVVVTWTDSSQTGGDTSSGAIRMQIIDPRDGIVTGTGNGETLYGHDLVNDEVSGFAGNDTLFGMDGNDALYGGEGADTLNGNEGDDRFYGGLGSDIYNGGLGNDWFFVEDAGDVVNEAIGEGTLDRVFASVSYTLTAGAEIEKFSTADHAGTAPINLTGNELRDNIFGNAGPNTLDGRGGADTMTGWGGDDFFFVDNAADVVIEAPGEGTDRVFASVSYALGAGQSIEKLTTTDNAGTAAINLTGNELPNLIFGNAGPNILDGKGGADTMFGLAGDDFYYVDNAGDVISESAGEGTGDRVLASVSYTLGAGVQVEKLSTDNNAGTAPLILIGNEFDNAIFGNAGSNSLRGMAGNDALFGLGGSDVFVFGTPLNAATNVDTIGDFAGDDDIFLISSIFSAIAPGTLAASAFVIGAAATTAAHRIIYNAGALLYDPDGVGEVAAVQFATLSGAPSISNADFIVV